MPTKTTNEKTSQEKKYSYERLEQQVADLKSRKEEADKKKATEFTSVSDSVQSVATDIIEACEKMRIASLKFRESIESECKLADLKQCPIHQSEVMLPDIDETMKASSLNGKFTLRRGECPLCKSQHLVNERHKKWIDMGIPAKVAHATFDNYEADIEPKKKALEKAKIQFLRDSGFLILCGNCGNGKSHLAAAVMKRVGSGLFITHEDLVTQLRNTYEDGGKMRLTKKYQKAECLVLDEIVPNLKGDDVVPFLYSILAHRFDKDLITVLTTNEDVTTLLEILGKKLEDRMAQNYTVATFTWESYRKQHREV